MERRGYGGRVMGGGGEGKVCRVCINLFLIFMYAWVASHLEVSRMHFTMATIALFSTSEQAHRAQVICNSEWMTGALRSVFWISIKVVTELFSCYMAGAMWNCCRLSAHSVYTIQPVHRVTLFEGIIYICRVHLYSAVTCHLHFWQNDRDLLYAAAVTRVERFS